MAETLDTSNKLITFNCFRPRFSGGGVSPSLQHHQFQSLSPTITTKVPTSRNVHPLQHHQVRLRSLPRITRKVPPQGSFIPSTNLIKEIFLPHIHLSQGRCNHQGRFTPPQHHQVRFQSLPIITMKVHHQGRSPPPLL